MLKPEELLAISAEISLRYTPLIKVKPAGFSGKVALTSKELLDISHEITRKFLPKLNTGTPKFVLLPVDPGHLYASWNLGAEKKDGVQLTNAPQVPTLRIYPLRTEETPESANEDWFAVNLAPGQTRQTIAIPESYKAPSYVADIGFTGPNNQFTVLATSKVTYNQPHNKAVSPFGNKTSSNGNGFLA